MKTTITIDTDLVKAVPVTLSDEMMQAMQAINNSLENKEYAAMHEEMLIAVPDTMPGVVGHRGEPSAYMEIHNHGGGSKSKILTLERPPKPQFAALKQVQELFTHPPAQPDTAALLARNSALEEAAAVCSTHAQQQSMFHQHAEMYCADFLANKIIKLITPEITPSPANSIAIMQARISELEVEVARLDAGWYKANGDLLEAQLAAQAGQEPVIEVTVDRNGGAIVHLHELEIGTHYLYADQPATTDPLAIVQAALDAAANIAVGHCWNGMAKEIRAIDPQTILDGMSK